MPRLSTLQAASNQLPQVAGFLLGDIFGTKLLDKTNIYIISSLGYDHFDSYPDVSTCFNAILLGIDLLFAIMPLFRPLAHKRVSWCAAPVFGPGNQPCSILCAGG
jgi:hypothetical protein